MWTTETSQTLSSDLSPNPTFWDRCVRPTRHTSAAVLHSVSQPSWCPPSPCTGLVSEGSRLRSGLYHPRFALHICMLLAQWESLPLSSWRLLRSSRSAAWNPPRLAAVSHIGGWVARPCSRTGHVVVGQIGRGYMPGLRCSMWASILCCPRRTRCAGDPVPMTTTGSTDDIQYPTLAAFWAGDLSPTGLYLGPNSLMHKVEPGVSVLQ